MHTFEYPIFFSYIDLKEISDSGYLLWPIFTSNDKVNERKIFSFCSFDESEHLKDFRLQDKRDGESLYHRTLRYLQKNSTSYLNMIDDTDKCDLSICLLTHLTYFGYCFNPVSFFYIFNGKTDNKELALHSIIAEVSNTPWIEQHPYILHELVEGVDIVRRNDSEFQFDASWRKAFHVSPFMDMDYKYNFKFTSPKHELKVHAKMLKISTGDIWFTVSLSVKAMEFNPVNLCYVLIWYPFHTRVIQLWIHLEAVKIFLKGVPVFEHPKGTDVDFGLGLTGDRIRYFFKVITWPVFSFYELYFNGKEKKSM